MHRTKNVLLIIPEMTMGGAQRSLANLSLELAKRFLVHLVVFNGKQKVAYPIGGEVHSLEVFTGSGMISKGIALYRRVKRLHALKKKLSIDVSISFLEGADYINVLSRNDEKIILSIRGSKVHDEHMHRYFFWLRSRILIPWLYKKADMVVAVNMGIVNELVTHHQLSEKKIITISNFYRVHEIIGLSEEPKEKSIEKLYDQQILVTSGRLSVEKGIDALIRIFWGLRKIRNDVRLIIIGDGPERQKLIALAEILGMATSGEDPDIIFLGDQKNVFKYVNGATLYLMNSSSEGFPNGLVEAMICGVPVISSDCPYGPREILHPTHLESEKQYGILMPIAKSVDTELEWVSKIDQLLADKEKLAVLSQGGRERAQHFDCSHIVQQWYNLIETDENQN